MTNNSNSSSGIGLFGMLTVLFVGLKLTGFIQWSWFWVTAPITVPLALLFVALGVCLFMAVVTGETKGKKHG